MSDTFMNTLSGQVKELSGQLIDTNKSSNELMTANSALRAENEELHGQLQQMQNSTKSLGITQNLLHGQINELNESIKMLAQQNSKQQTLLNKKDELIEKLTAQLATVNESINTLPDPDQAPLESALAQQNDALLTANKELMTDIERLEVDRKNLIEQLDALEL